MCKINYTRLLVTVILSSCALLSAADGSDDNGPKGEDIWEQDLSDAFKIDASTKGIKEVNLKCGSNSMLVQFETEEDFTGVMYTRGSFYKQTEPCFTKAQKGKRILEMRFQFDQCQTIQDGDVFSNVVIIQHDPELVTPGDSAFSLECDFRKSRSLSVGADFQARDKNMTEKASTDIDPNQETMATPNPDDNAQSR